MASLPVFELIFNLTCLTPLSISFNADQVMRGNEEAERHPEANPAISEAKRKGEKLEAEAAAGSEKEAGRAGQSKETAKALRQGHVHSQSCTGMHIDDEA